MKLGKRKKQIWQAMLDIGGAHQMVFARDIAEATGYKPQAIASMLINSGYVESKWITIHTERSGGQYVHIRVYRLNARGLKMVQQAGLMESGNTNQQIRPMRSHGQRGASLWM